MVERIRPLLNFLHSGNELFGFALPREQTQAIQIFISEECRDYYSASFDDRQLCIHDEACQRLAAADL